MNYDSISIIIPVYNVNTVLLSKSFESITNQTFKNFEAIIIDDSTNILTSQHCKEYCNLDNRFRYIRPSEKLGLVNALNLGIKTCKFDLVARFDSDDICIVDRLEKQISFMKNNQDIDVLGGNIEVINSDDVYLYTREYPTNHLEIARSMHITCPIAHPTVLYKKEVIERNGYYNSDFKFAEDIDLWLRLLSAGVKFANLNIPLIKYRQDNLVRNKDHYKFFLKARIKNFSLRFFPINIVGIFMLLIINYSPDFILNLYYTHRYKIEK
jgi:glycosyltransferase involved in cell wall biosynthesis